MLICGFFSINIIKLTIIKFGPSIFVCRIFNMFLLGCSVEVLVSLVNTGIIGKGPSYRRGTVETWSRGGVYQAQRSQRLKEPSAVCIGFVSLIILSATDCSSFFIVSNCNRASGRSRSSSSKYSFSWMFF